MNAPRFSIITVTFNPGEALGKTVESLKAQCYTGFEHIIKDAKSTDGSVERYGQPARDYDPIVVCRPDGGIYEGMNQAIDVASGNYLLFLNAGDTFYTPDVLANLAPFCEQEESPDLIYCDYAIEGGKARVRSPSKLSRFYLFRTMLCHQVCFVKLDCYRDLGGFNTNLRIEADYDFLLRLMLRPKARCLYVPVIATAFLGGGVSSDPANYSLMRSEVRGLRKKYFPGWEGRAFALLYACTLPRLRIGIMRSPKFRSLATCYRYGVNLWRKWSAV